MKIAAHIAVVFEKLSRFLLYLAVLLAPLPFGSVSPQAICLQVALLGTCIILSALQPKLPSHSFTIIFLLAGFAGIWTGAAYLQTSAWFHSGIENPIWLEAGRALNEALPANISVVRDLPVAALGASFAAMLALGGAFALSHNYRHAQRLLGWIALTGFGYAVFGVVSFILDPASTFGLPKEAYRTVLTSTFVNRNTAAVYFGCCSVIWLLIIFQALQARSPNRLTFRALFHHLIFRPRFRLLCCVFAYLMCVVSMVMTGSRAGSVFSLLGNAFFVAMYFARSLSNRTSLALFVAGALVWFTIVIQILGAGVAERFDAEGFSDVARLNSYRSTLRAITQAPLLGTGLGTFEWAFPSYRGEELSVRGRWERAHSTPLEIAAEMGLPICILVLLVWGGITYLFGRAVYLNSRKAALPAAAASIFLIASLHSVIDFSLQTSGFAVVIFAALGAGLAQSVKNSATLSREPKMDLAN